MDTLLLIIALLLVLAGLLGSFLPVLPGPPLAFGGLALLKFSETMQPSDEQLGMHLVAAAGITLLDYYVPVWGTKRFGGSKAGTRGAMIGLVIGLFMGPLGIIVGPFVGALLAEMVVGRPGPEALRAATGAFLGFLAGVLMKVAYAIVVLFHILQLL